VLPRGVSLGVLGRLALVALCCWVLTAPASRAQIAGGIPEFFQRLFGFPQTPQAAPRPAIPPTAHPHRPRKREQDFVSSTATRTPGSPGGAPVQPTFFVSVLGDSLGVSAAQGLEQAFADKPEISVTNAARDLSGLTREDYYDWPHSARDLAVGKSKIDFVVIMIGINDLQPIKDGAEALDPLTDRWRAIYAQRAQLFAAPFRDARVPVLWVGLPPMRDERFNNQVIALNEIYRQIAQQSGAKFIDIWDAFSDQDGQYSAFGPDVDGQNVKLRADPNGIYFTKAGARKLAEFLQPEIRRAYDKTKPQGDLADLPPDIEREADDINARIRSQMGGESPGAGNGVSSLKPVAGPILSLSARPVSTHGVLVGTLDSAPAVPGEQAQALRLGQASEPRAGRADDFSWPRP
jgi:uncharacterized protein